MHTMEKSLDGQRFLAKAVSILATSLDFRETIDNLAELAVSRFADWCAVFIIENEHSLRRLVITRNNSNTAETAPEEKVLALELHALKGPGHVIRTSGHELISPVTDDILASMGVTRTELALGGAVTNPSSYLSVPLVARGRTIGAIAFLSADPARPFDEEDLALAGDLACAAALALDNSRLYREAQEANRLKDEFVAMVSHELRTPLTPILGCIHLLRTAKLSEANFARALEMIERNAHAQVQIVEDLLDVSRIVAGKLHLVMKSIEIIPVLEAAVDSVRPMAEAKGVQIVTNFGSVKQVMHGDPDRVQQIVWNLLSNAVKFTPPEGRVEVFAWQDRDVVRIQVIDTGVGIPENFMPYIFDRFRQAEEAATKMRSGLGLGLAIVRHLVDLHHGSIEASSPGAGQGAVFTLTFPLQAKAAALVTTS
jgi:signal transduction histidine kinase